MTRSSSSSSSLLVRTAFVAAAAAALEGASSFAPPFASPPVCRRGFLVGPPVAAQVVASTTGTTSGLLMSAGAAEAAALGFFSGVRIPAALIAGSSLGALFSLVDRTSRNGGEEEEGGGKAAGADGGRRWEDRLVATYHVLSLVSLLLSLNVVITATAAGSTLLLDVQGSSGASSAFEFLAGEMRYELLTTRWSFFAGLLSFLGAVAARVLVEFDLLASRRRRKFAGVFLLCASSLATHVVSIINGSLYSTTNLAALTVEVIKVSDNTDPLLMRRESGPPDFPYESSVLASRWPHMQLYYFHLPGLLRPRGDDAMSAPRRFVRVLNPGPGAGRVDRRRQGRRRC